ALANCVATMDETEQTQAALVALADPSAAMKTGDPDRAALPRVELEHCFVRGKGDLLSVQPSRAFELAVGQALLGLDGSLGDVEGGSREPPPGPGAAVRLTRLTAYLTGPVLRLGGGGERVGAAPALVGTQVTTEECLFVAAAGRAAVKAEGLDAEQ